MESEADATADSSHTQNKSLTSRPRAGLSRKTRGEVTNQPDNAGHAPLTRGGVTTGTADPRTSMPNRPPPKEQKKSHQCAALTINRHPLDQVTTKGAQGKET